MFTLETVTTLARFEQLEPEWNRLADASGNPLLRHEWFMASARAFTPEAELAVQVAWDGDRIRAAAPFGLKRIGGVLRCELLGAENFEPEAFLWDDERALAEVCEAVARVNRPVVLTRLPAHSRELSLLDAAGRDRGAPVLRPITTRTYCNPIGTPDWAAYQAAMSSGRRKELERKRRKLEQHGPVTFEAISPSADELDAPYAALMEVEGSGWKARNGTAIAQNMPARSFFADLGRRMAERGMLRLFFLKSGDHVVAAQYHIQYGGKLWELKIAYDEAFGKHSPGALLTHEVLRWSCEQGLIGLEHLGSAEDWQRRWPVEQHDQSTWRYYPRTLDGAIAFARDGLEFVRRRMGDPATRAAPARADAPGVEAQPAEAAGSRLPQAA